MPPILHLTVGLPGAGKTTAAIRIAERERILRLTPDEWMAPLFGDGTAGGARDVVEGRMIDVARQVLRSGVGVILDFGCWSPEERWAIRAITEASGGTFRLVVLDIDEGERRRRADRRWREAPATTFAMTDAEHDEYRRSYRAPGIDEMEADALPPCPDGFASWGAWAAWRWPTLPVVATSR